MKNKEFAIYNPTSAYPLVFLNKKNMGSVDLHLSGNLVDAEVAFDDTYIQLQKKTGTASEKIYKFRVHPEPFNWNSYSNVFIGGIEVGKSSEILLLAKTEYDFYKDYITIISPINNVIRLKPNQTLEVVYFQKDYDYTWTPGADIQMQEVTMSKKTPDINEAIVKYFGFTNSIYYKLDINQKSFYAGEFTFKHGKSNNFLKVYVDLNDKYKRRMYQQCVSGHTPTANAKTFTFSAVTTDADTLLTREVTFEKVDYVNLADGCKIFTGEKEKNEDTKTETSCKVVVNGTCEPNTGTGNT